MDRVKISFVENDNGQLTIEADRPVLCGQYDNNSVVLSIQRPDKFINDDLVASFFFVDGGPTFSTNISVNNAIPVSEIFTRYRQVFFSIQFREKNGIIKSGTNTIRFLLRPSLHPESPPDISDISYLLENAIVRVEQIGNIVNFYNSIGDIVGGITLSEPEQPVSGAREV